MVRARGFGFAGGGARVGARGAPLPFPGALPVAFNVAMPKSILVNLWDQMISSMIEFGLYIFV